MVTAVTLIDQGVFNAAGMTNVSNLLWNRMSAEDRAVLAHAAQFAQTISVQSWIDNTNAAREAGTAQGIAFITPDGDMMEAAAAFRETHLAELATALEAKGVTGAADKIARYQDLLAKWEGLVVCVSTPEELAELRYDEIWSKLDYDTYGL